MLTRRSKIATTVMGAALCVALATPLLPAAAFGMTTPSDAAAMKALPATATDPSGTLPLLSDPYLQMPGADDVYVVWNTEFAGTQNVALVGSGVAALSDEDAMRAAAGATFANVELFAAESMAYSRMAEDSGSRLDEKPAAEDGIVTRDVWRHEAHVTGLAAGERVAYRVVSAESTTDAAISGTFSLAPVPRAGDSLRVLLTSDHQAMANTPANLQKAAETIGDIDAVFLAGDLVNQPDRASEWFDDTRGSAFFATLQGNGGRIDNNGVAEYYGGEIVQNAPLFPAVGNHEVQGRIDGMTSIGSSFGAPVPVPIAEQEYEKVAAVVNPAGDATVKAKWIEDNSFSTRTYEEVFTLPDSSPGGETYYATSFGDIRLISLYSTRIWRGTTAQADPAARTSNSRYQEAVGSLDDPLAQGYGEHVFESLAVGSEQYEWLQEELESDDFHDARFRIVMLHEGPQGLGDNVMPLFADPVRIEEKNADGDVIGVRYEYPAEGNMLLNDLSPLLEDADVDLVHNGHSHLWNRFVSENGVNYMETSNTGNSYGAFHELSGRSRPLPPEPWDASNYMAQGNPGGLEPIVPNVKPFENEDGVALPFVQSNDLAVFTMLDTGANEVVSYAYDVRTPEVEPWVIDRFAIGRELTEPSNPEEPGEPGNPEEPGEPGNPEEPGEQAPDLTDAAVKLSASTVVAGGSLSVTGTGFTAGETVRVELHSTPVMLGTAVADASGAISVGVKIPESTTAGRHEIVLVTASGERASGVVTVTSAGPLAVTGADAGRTWSIALVASLALALGGALLWWRTVRRSAA
ncbi:hypothetical protein FHX48_001922 [Microbacterium halimionae]|uniref:Calcineurin-like phosphoesterase domain-containing protein n=1 Tax=Microbacterium halimionae TaxID=1526413 RepID=A0A7W3JPZ2_9MICO|nr:metallophosphoesterase [Microbacterium halimionae]MBA8816829.1 hypothetical protein [Microbacterium halimionae]NII94875.1 hypothetical protein [Microbacterium halimionae]